MSVSFHPDPGRDARKARLGFPPPARPIVFRPAPVIPPAPGAAETAGPVDLLPDSAPPVPIRPPSPDGPLAIDIIEMVAFWHGYTYDDILGFSRHASLVTARYDAIAAVVRCKTDYSPEFIGRIFKRDRTTIVHAMKKMNTGPRVRPPRSASSDAGGRG